jgi:hypothetical protein
MQQGSSHHRTVQRVRIARNLQEATTTAPRSNVLSKMPLGFSQTESQALGAK